MRCLIMEKKLYLSDTDKKLSGVCGGIAEYFGIDSTIVRIICVILSFASLGTAILVYIICCFVIPKRPYSKDSW